MRRARDRRGSATILDVARAADVSPATVSRCLNRPHAVRAELRARVEMAVDRLGYLPNQAARALVSRRSATVGAVFPSLDSALFGRALESLQATLEDIGLDGQGCDGQEFGHKRSRIRGWGRDEIITGTGKGATFGLISSG